MLTAFEKEAEWLPADKNSRTCLHAGAGYPIHLPVYSYRVA